MDYMIALAELETEAARRVVESARDEEDYYKEKAAAKMLAFFEHDERSIRMYAEVKLYHPEIADLLEGERPHLVHVYNDALEGWQALEARPLAAQNN